jgi:hypothetical protein
VALSSSNLDPDNDMLPVDRKLELKEGKASSVHSYVDAGQNRIATTLDIDIHVDWIRNDFVICKGCGLSSTEVRKISLRSRDHLCS